MSDGRHISNYPEMVEALRASFLQVSRKWHDKSDVRPYPNYGNAHHYVEVAEHLPQVLDAGEQLLVLLAAERDVVKWTSARRAAVLAVTDRRLIVLLPNGVVEDFPLDEIEAADLEKLPVIKERRLAVKVGSRTRRWSRLRPSIEGERLLGGLRGDFDDLPCPPLGTYRDTFAYPGRLVAGDQTFDVDEQVEVAVGSAGAIATRTDLSVSGAIGGAVVGATMLGPLGAVLGLDAASQQKILDSRTLYILVEGPNWAWSESGLPGTDKALQTFAQAIRLCGRLAPP